MAPHFSADLQEGLTFSGKIRGHCSDGYLSLLWPWSMFSYRLSPFLGVLCFLLAQTPLANGKMIQKILNLSIQRMFSIAMAYILYMCMCFWFIFTLLKIWSSYCICSFISPYLNSWLYLLWASLSITKCILKAQKNTLWSGQCLQGIPVCSEGTWDEADNFPLNFF